MAPTLNYPLHFEFKVLAFSPQFFVKDDKGNEVAYVKQKLFKLKEDITVFENESQTKEIYKIKANKWIDWSASYLLNESSGGHLGRMGRKGMRSLWKATYEVFDENDKQCFKIVEANAFIKIMDGMFSEIPILGLFTGYVFNPEYDVMDMKGNLIAKFTKVASFLGKKFTLQPMQEISNENEERLILSLMMMVLLERRRG